MSENKIALSTSKSFIGRALIDDATTISGKIAESMFREPNVVIEELKFQGGETP